MKAAELQVQKWKGIATDGSDTKLLIGGEFVSSKTNKWIDVHDPVSLFRFVLFHRLTSLNGTVHAGCVD
jgi:hypothetical protein